MEKRLRPETADRINTIARELGVRVRFVKSIRGLISKLTGEEKRKAQTAEGKLLAAMEEGRRQAKTNGGLKNVGGKTPSFSLKQIQALTEGDVQGLLENAMNGQYVDGSYIPLRKNTPSILIEKVTEYSGGRTAVEDLPIVMNVGKARQAMSEDYGEMGKRQHEISTESMLDIIRGMDDPSYIVLQENGRYVEVVPFYDGRRRKAWAVLDFGDMKNPEFMNGYEGGSFNVSVTAFEPDDLQKYLHSRGNKIVFQKK